MIKSNRLLQAERIIRESAIEKIMSTTLTSEQEQEWIEKARAKTNEGFAVLERGETIVNQLLEKFE